MILYHGRTDIVEKNEIRKGDVYLRFRSRFLYDYIAPASGRLGKNNNKDEDEEKQCLCRIRFGILIRF